MGVPDFQSIMLPLLKFASDKNEHSSRESIEYLGQEFNLTEEDRKELLPSGTQAVFDNRVGWSRTYLKKAGLLESKKRGYFNITDDGLKVLEQNPTKINIDFLMQFPGYVEFRTGVKKDISNESEIPKEDLTPEESLEYSYQKLRIM